MEKVLLFKTSPEELVQEIKMVVQAEIANLQNDANNHRLSQEILSRKETAKLLGISLVTLHDWSKSGILRPYKLGNRTYFKKSEILEVLSNSNPGVK